MKVILTQPVESVGEVGQIVNVRVGYARNFLLPRRMAVIADEGNVQQVNHQKRLLEAQRKKIRAGIEEQAARVSSKSVTIACKVGDQEKLYGSVTAQDIADALHREGLDFVDKKQIVLDEPIKQLGVYTVEIRLAPDMTATTKVFVVSE